MPTGPRLLDSSSEEDTFLGIAEHVAELLNEGQEVNSQLTDTPGSAFLGECATLLSKQQVEPFLAKMLSQLDMVLSKSSEKDAESVANVLVHTLARIPAAQRPSSVQTFANALTAKVDEHAHIRLGALLNLYGALHESPSVQRRVLLSAVDYARRGPKLAAMLVPAVRGKSGEWISTWKLDESQSRELLVALATLVKVGTDRGSVKEYQRLVGCALELCKEGDAKAIEQVRPLAVQAVAEFVRSTTVFQADWAGSPAVKALDSDPATKPLYTLFSAVLAGNMKDFKSAATAAALEAAGTTLEAATFKACMLALLALCSTAGRQEVTFKAIQAALDVPEDQVENWVVRAIGAKLMEGRIDQVRGVVLVSRSTQRTFGSSEWGNLAAQLASWREALGQVKQTMAGHEGLAATAAAAASATGGKPTAVRA
eukprot:CAMPEP_0119101946 /NCGR_PEP_ID=MMETSP1180-20130426/837_1 /TAXON_ID=3052 ORGANISM="Chlamydomonas cf sp, Strain CCMP681" /NCGR_SAMPLE_ID=MMETSP1180 /ASSEMBLY_ACC=CAM_ASM_000741 /LENGTH=426 /DNA_ID=CAMNT_0007086135 /DNA_START=90 /DNA_END=1370 /DNA_ORIENTATION=-